MLLRCKGNFSEKYKCTDLRERRVEQNKIRIQLTKPWIEDAEYRAIEEVLNSGYLTDGQVTHQFEKEVADYVGVQHAVATTSCATALDLALRALGVTQGDEVIVPDFTHPATANVVKLVGAKPVLVPVDPKTYNVTPEILEAAVTERTKCLLPVSLFGQPLDMKRIMKLAKEKGLFVIEDAACSIGAIFDGVKTGSLPDVTCFSFHPRKVITTGEGGMLVTNNENWATLARSMKHFGVSGTWPGTKIAKFTTTGTNYKLTNIQSAIGRVQLKRIEKIISTRRQKAKIYDELLAKLNFIKAPFVPSKAHHIYQTYCTQLDPSINRNAVIEAMAEKGIETQIGSYCLHIQPNFANEKRHGDLSSSKRVYEQSLALPLHKDITEEDQKFIVQTLKEIFNKHQGSS